MIPALVQWELTEHCPYRCIYCYLLDASLLRQTSNLPDGVMFQIAELLVNYKIFYVTLTGGEPLTRHQLVVDLTHFLSDNGIILSLNTCLEPLTDEVLADLRVDHFLISCPSSEPKLYAAITGSGSYDRFEGQLRQVIATGINHTVNMVVSQLNRHGVRSTATHMAELGIRRFAATPVSLNARAPKFELLLSQMDTRAVLDDLVWVHEYLGLEVDVMEALPQVVIPTRAFELRLPFVYRACQAGKRNGTIAANGDVRPCGHNPRVYGNVLNDDLGQIWDRMQDWRQHVENTHRSCLACDLANSGGCPIDAVSRDTSSLQEILSQSTPVLVPPPSPDLTADTIVSPSRRYLERPEDNGWLVTSGRSRDILHVNHQLRDFLVATRVLGRLSLGTLAERFGTQAEDPEFRRILSILVLKHFFLLTNINQSAAAYDTCGSDD